MLFSLARGRRRAKHPRLDILFVVVIISTNDIDDFRIAADALDSPNGVYGVRVISTSIQLTRHNTRVLVVHGRRVVSYETLYF